ncbi:hypothetical protein J1N35_009152 [Gossypium stocksii]|uniref:Uncharacterized protein n=1 Tax=Gossypium stocksii TaxID=47602 RepID=A0A9D3VYM8_9ROSI|nr:hypothetical protein J1N35_009152 [Gossypium stocksii]
MALQGRFLELNQKCRLICSLWTSAILFRCIQDFQVFVERARAMLQWMRGSRQKVTITHSFTQRQRQYFEQRKQQEKKTGYEGHADETSIAGRHQKECRSLDILSLLNLLTFSAVGKCYPSNSLILYRGFSTFHALIAAWASLYLLLFSNIFDKGSSNDLIVNRSSIISNMILGDQTAYLPKSEKLEKVLKEASRLYAASWVRAVGPDLRPNDYNKDDGTEGKSNGDKSRNTETEPSTLEDIAIAARGGMEPLRPVLQRLYMTRASAYRDALKSFIEGYQEGPVVAPAGHVYTFDFHGQRSASARFQKSVQVDVFFDRHSVAVMLHSLKIISVLWNLA